MDVGMITRWGVPKPGRERESVENYHAAVAFCRRLVEEGRLSYFEPFFFSTGDGEVENGFFIIKGPVAEVFAILETEEYRDLLAKGQLLNEHVHVDMLTVGEGIDRVIGDYQKAIGALNV